jgi:hypothetical protein
MFVDVTIRKKNGFCTFILAAAAALRLHPAAKGLG